MAHAPANTIHTTPKLDYAARMTDQVKRKSGPLIRAVVVLQVKLLLSTARDLVLIPLVLIAALVDLVRLKEHEPQWFRQVLGMGERSDRWIDVWYANHDAQGGEPRENVDALLTRVEEVVRDREQGARQARVLKRWAERQMQRAKLRATAEVSTRMKAMTDKRGGSE